MMPNIIRYSGLKHLTVEQQALLRSIMDKEYPRIQRIVKNITDLKVDLKVKSETGKRRRFMIALKAVSPTAIFSVRMKENEKIVKAWDLPTVAHRSVENLMDEMKHRLKSDTAGWKKTSLKKAMSRRLY